jgi:hypothetical protein
MYLPLRPALLIRLVPILAVLLLVGRSLSDDDPTFAQTPDASSARVYEERAVRTRRFTFEHLAYLIGSDDCESAAALSFRRELGSPLSDAWYNGSQLMADAAMAPLGEPTHSCDRRNTVAFLDLLAGPDPPGGYFPRANVDASDVATRDPHDGMFFADDNALLGLAFLEARAVSLDSAWRTALLRRSKAAARFLIQGGLWDETFGGGFWWNTARGVIGEGKPAQTTALAAQLFARLYEETGDETYARWARRGLSWLDARLFDPDSGLYRYNVRHDDVPGASGEFVDSRFFSYDQGIMIELHLLFDRAVAPNAGHLDRARALARTLQPTFWEPERGGYRLQADQPDVYTGYSAWLTQSLLALYAVDPDPAWLDAARANLEALESRLLDPADGGYFHMHYRCGPNQAGCEDGASWAHDPTKLLYSQAWMQRAQALLATTLRRSTSGTEVVQTGGPRTALPPVEQAGAGGDEGLAFDDALEPPRNAAQ